MHIRNLTQKLDIDFVISDQWPLPVHKHTHYELQYILRGKGQHIINGITCTFEKDDLFVLAPQDTHFFVFEQRSAICIIKFNKGLFETQLQDEEFIIILKQLSAPLRKKISGGRHRQLITQLMELIVSQHRKGAAHQQLVIKNTLVLVLALTAGDQAPKQVAVQDEKIQSILFYIDRHITDRHQLKVEKISGAFHISKHYFNQYFKRATGTTYKKYIQDYALQLIAQQLTRQNRTLKELAADFGFTDESHLSNAFKAHFHQSPSAYRKKSQPL